MKHSIQDMKPPTRRLQRVVQKHADGNHRRRAKDYTGLFD